MKPSRRVFLPAHTQRRIWKSPAGEAVNAAKAILEVMEKLDPYESAAGVYGFELNIGEAKVDAFIKDARALDPFASNEVDVGENPYTYNQAVEKLKQYRIRTLLELKKPDLEFNPVDILPTLEGIVRGDISYGSSKLGDQLVKIIDVARKEISAYPENIKREYEGLFTELGDAVHKARGTNLFTDAQLDGSGTRSAGL